MVSQGRNSTVREPAVAGLFYPANAAELGRVINALMANAKAQIRVPRALIAPHAGYVYSGPTAAAAYACVSTADTTWQRVVLLGPAHRVAVRGIALSSASAFATPLGNIDVDRQALKTLQDIDGVVVSDRVHANEHSLEVHLPFIKRLLGDARLVPLVIGEASVELVSTVIARLADPKTLIIVSSDLSHYHRYDEARRIDTDTLELIKARYQSLHGDQACGCRAINGLNHYAAQQGWVDEVIAYANSGDTAGDLDHVVGYSAIAYYETSSCDSKWAKA